MSAGRPTAPFACRAEAPPRRQVAETEPAERTRFQRDRDRIVHSAAFRRLASKTQVFMPGTDEDARTRLTHSLEVAQIARSLARALGLEEDLTEALALAHDLGHAPFGHTGEDALAEAVSPHADFDHNVQSLRVVVDLERRYLAFDGLNLTWDTLEGLAKRNGPCAAPSPLLRHYDGQLGLQLDRYPGAEAQVAALADDVAYNAHDVEDGLRSGLLTLADLDAVPFLRDLGANVGEGGPNGGRMPFALARALVDVFVRDALAESRRRLARHDPADADAVRALPAPVIALSPPMAAAAAAIKALLFRRLYRHPTLLERRRHASGVIADLARCYLADPGRIPGDPLPAGEPLAVRARRVCDAVASMTDRRALAEHARLFDAHGDSA